MIWTVAGAVFDTRQARRLFPLVTGAAIAGSLVGNLSAGPLAGLLGTASLILVEAMLLVAASSCSRARRCGPTPPSLMPEPSRASWPNCAQGWTSSRPRL